MIEDAAPQPGDGPTHLQSIRQSAHLTQEHVAHAAGISLRTLRNIELGAVSRPHKHTLLCLAEVLGLNATESDTFVGFWHPRPPGGELEIPDLLRPSIDSYLTPDQLRTKHDWTSLAKRSRDVYAAHRGLLTTDMDDIVRADRDDVRRATLLLHGNAGRGRNGLLVTDTRNCSVVGQTPIPEFEAQILDIEFAVTLRQGDVYRWGISIEYGTPASSITSSVAGIGFGIARGGPSLTQEVGFADEARPADLHYAWFSHAMQGRELARRPLGLNGLGGAMFHLPAAPVGIHKIAWEW